MLEEPKRSCFRRRAVWLCCGVAAVAGEDIHEAKGKRAGLPQKLAAGEHLLIAQSDAAGIEQPGGSLEEFCALDKEGALLGEEELVDTQVKEELVGLEGGKVGIESQVHA